VDPDSNRQAESGSVFGIQIRILEVKLSYKNPLFQQTLHDFHLFFKMIANESPLFNKKKPTLLVEKNTYFLG